MRQFCQQTALVQLAYFALRTAWHVGVPAYLGGEPSCCSRVQAVHEQRAR